MDKILRERNGVVLKGIYGEDENATEYRVHSVDNEDDYKTFRVYNGEKETAYMLALSEYLYRAGIIEKSMAMLKNEIARQSYMPYDKMKNIAETALKTLKREDLLDELDLDDDDKEFFNVADKVLLKTYKITRIETHYVTVAVDMDAYEYEIQDSDFTIPPLTLQPMVENAIRHGVRVRKEGVVRVLTKKTAAGHEIIIRDNGKGFDAKEAETKEGQHLGIRNVRERVESMCGGTLTIESTEETGTVVTITIPDRE